MTESAGKDRTVPVAASSAAASLVAGVAVDGVEGTGEVELVALL